MSTAPIEPTYVISLDEIAWGGALVAITMVMHAFGMLATLRVNHMAKNRLGTKQGQWSGLFFIILASWMILLVHLTEAMVWAAFFMWKDAFGSYSIAYYFSLNEYTTLGSNFNLPRHWRLLEGMLAMAGLLAFAWSTGVLFTLAQDFQNQRMQWLEQRHRQDSTRLTSARNTTPDGTAG
jgi:hypothetical protein